MVTLKSIAEKAGVSVGTVSIALGLNSARQRLRPATRESVLAAAAELGYRRNAYAQGLASGHTAVVGFVCWSFSEWHNAQLFEGLAEAAGARGYLVKTFRYSPVDEAEVARRLIEQRVSVAVAVGPAPSAARVIAAELNRFSIPFCFVSGELPRNTGPALFTDDRAGCRLVVEHLWNAGRRRFALVGTRRTPGPFHLRREAFLKAIEKAGGSVPSRCILDHDSPEAQAIEPALRELLAGGSGRPPDAVCSTSDAFAALAVREARRAGLRVPEDLAVTGFGDAPIAPLCDPPLTTVHQPFPAVGQILVDALIDERGQPRAATRQRFVVPVRLVVRGSG